MNPFAFEGLGADFEKSAWVVPSVDVARENKRLQVYGGKLFFD